MKVLLEGNNQIVSKIVGTSCEQAGCDLLNNSIGDNDDFELLVKDCENDTEISEFDQEKTLFLVPKTAYDKIDAKYKISKPFLPIELINFLSEYSARISRQSDMMENIENLNSILNDIDELDALVNLGVKEPKDDAEMSENLDNEIQKRPDPKDDTVLAKISDKISEIKPEKEIIPLKMDDLLEPEAKEEPKNEDSELELSKAQEEILSQKVDGISDEETIGEILDDLKVPESEISSEIDINDADFAEDISDDMDLHALAKKLENEGAEINEPKIEGLDEEGTQEIRNILHKLDAKRPQEAENGLEVNFEQEKNDEKNDEKEDEKSDENLEEKVEEAIEATENLAKKMQKQIDENLLAFLSGAVAAKPVATQKETDFDNEKMDEELQKTLNSAVENISELSDKILFAAAEALKRAKTKGKKGKKSKYEQKPIGLISLDSKTKPAGLIEAQKVLEIEDKHVNPEIERFKSKIVEITTKAIKASIEDSKFSEELKDIKIKISFEK